MKQNQGSSLVELLLYTALLATILAVLYELLSVAGYRKIGEVVEDEIYVNANHFTADVSRTITAANTIDEPAPGVGSSILSLDSGSIVYRLDENNRLTKTEQGVTDFLTSSAVAFENLSFTRHGPSTESPTISISFSIAGVHTVEGRVMNEDFQTAVSLR